MSRAHLVALAVLVAGSTACIPYLGPSFGSDLPEHQGGESPELLDDLRGTIVWVDAWDDREALQVEDLASRARRTIELDDPVIAVSGPDEDGDVACLERTGWWSHGHRIVVVSLRDGSSRTILEAQKELDGWSSRVEIAPRGGRIALVRNPRDEGGSSETERGVVVLDSSGTAFFEIEGVDAPSMPRWLPDSRTLAYSTNAGAEPETWAVDVESGARKRIGDGLLCALATDGSIALVRVRTQVRLLDVATGNVLVEDVLLEGPSEGRGTPRALVGTRLAIHDGLPRRGAEQKNVFGQVGPGSGYPLRLSEWSTDRSTLLISDTWNAPFSYSPFEFHATAH